MVRRVIISAFVFLFLPAITVSGDLFNVKLIDEQLEFRLALEAEDRRYEKNDELMINVNQALNEIELYHFLDKLAKLESAKDWTIVNRYGYVGKYQFGSSARKAVGAPRFTADEFKEDPYIWPESQQDSAVVKLMRLNNNYLLYYFNEPGDHLHEFINNTVVLRDKSKVKITYAGLLAASHLVGPRSVRSFLNTNGWIDKKDGNGTKCSDYMKKFENNNLYLNYD